MAELRGLHAPLAAFLHIIDTSRLLTVLKNDKRAIFTATSFARRAADFLSNTNPAVREEAA
jgi:antirestriction protein ArdC